MLVLIRGAGDLASGIALRLHTRICQPTAKIRITSLSLLSQRFPGFFFF